MSADAILSVDEDQTIWLFNGGAEQIFGYSRDEMLGKPLSVLIPHRFQAQHDGHLELFASSGLATRLMGERMEVFGGP
jgi:PAS domain S-box-containing protein